MEKVNEIKLPKGVDSISVTQHDDKIVIEFIPKKPKFKQGDFVYEDGRIMIVKKYPYEIYALIYPKIDMLVIYDDTYGINLSLSFRYATEDEKQLLIDAMRKDGKRWNADKKCVEDIPKRKFKEGDKVRIKDGISSKTHGSIKPNFISAMDEFIGKELTVKGYSGGYVFFNEDDFGYKFDKDWLEPWSDEPKNGDLAIFWDYSKDIAIMRTYREKKGMLHYDSIGYPWKNAIKFESKEQFEKVLRVEIN